jgi:hypothetical protein
MDVWVLPRRWVASVGPLRAFSPPNLLLLSLLLLVVVVLLLLILLVLLLVLGVMLVSSCFSTCY